MRGGNSKPIPPLSLSIRFASKGLFVRLDTNPLISPVFLSLTNFWNSSKGISLSSNFRVIRNEQSPSSDTFLFCTQMYAVSVSFTFCWQTGQVATTGASPIVSFSCHMLSYSLSHVDDIFYLLILLQIYWRMIFFNHLEY